MAENKRQYLADGSTLLLSRKRDGSAPEQYTILKCIGAGGSTVCYDARRTLPDGTVRLAPSAFSTAKEVEQICKFFIHFTQKTLHPAKNML